MAQDFIIWYESWGHLFKGGNEMILCDNLPAGPNNILWKLIYTCA